MPRPPMTTVRRRDLLMGAACISVFGQTAGHARGAATDRYPAVRQLMTGMIDGRAFPGGIVAIGRDARQPDLVSSGTIALDSRRPVDKDTLFRVYSMTKPITGMAAMLLIAEGRMKLDQPVADFIPAFANMRVLTSPREGLATRPAATVMTIRHLLTHTAGLGGGPAMQGPLKAEYGRLGLMQGLRSRAERQKAAHPTVTSLKDYAERLATAPLMSDPGTTWSYSVSLDLLGRIIELASGMAFDQFLERRFFAPLKMAGTSFRVPSGDKLRLATSYDGRGAKLAAVDPGSNSIFLDEPAFPSGGGGLVSSAHDYDRFLAMLANRGSVAGVEIMPAAAVALGTSNLLPEGANMRGYLGIPGVVGFGAGGSICDHGGFKGVYGWMGAAGTIGVVVPSQQLRITGLINNLAVFDFATRLASAVHADLNRTGKS